MNATSGGYKISYYYSNRRENYNGVTGSRTVTLTFDLQRPTHCIETSTCTPEDKLIDVGPEIDKQDKATRYIAWSGWTDADSGLETFAYKVYELTPAKDDGDRLVEKPSPFFSGTQPARITSSTAAPTYTLPGPGMYSVVLESAVSTNPKRPMSVLDLTSVTEEGETYVWVTSAIDKDHPVTVTWPGHFENTFHNNNKLLNEVKPGKADKGLDDNHGDRTVNAIPNVHGIVKFQAGFTSIKSGEPSKMKNLGQEEKYKAIVGNGKHIRVLVRATDVMGNSAGDWLTVRVDSSAPTFVGHTFEKNVDCSGTKLSFCSKITLKIHDTESGIKAIDYVVTDIGKDKDLWTETKKGEQPTNNIVKSCQDDGSCVCTPFNGCYLRDQVFYFDHCWLVNGTVERPIRVKVNIYNHAGLKTSKEIKLGVLEGLKGIDRLILLLLILIIFLLLFCMMRRRQNKPYIPSSFADFNRTLAQSSMFGGNRAKPSNGVSFKSNANLYDDDYADGYGGDYDDDISLYGNMDTDDVADWKIPAGNVVLGDKLPNAKGRFADIHSATLKSKGGRQNIVAKTLKTGGNAESRKLMTAKMNFWAQTCPKHENILLCLGAVINGPILLFELCDLGTLGSWLISQPKVTEDLEDKMITFSLHVARGLQELHTRKLVHRRLGVRNVLLKSDNVGGIVAKVAGFGPMRGEVQAGDKIDETIPVKWMSPEQLNLNAGQRRKYNNKTDVWSFGVTLWEIFSKGGAPYPDIRSRELKKQLANGYRMSRPTHCPDNMFDQVIEPCWRESAPSRPTVAAIVTKIETLFVSGASGDVYYADENNKAFEPDV
ncbi:hypothetical protein NP493_652g00038 [Ridgeia piscesae]|uniref:Protein kinase domain-containing protein n=1 Tax=Ridgeia piscesae TaxID=27915 RepID=A0AAD9NN89_RIDPI|nr:hypothetical protein NP493_652g00038 [Ridgeia piscesae]